MAFGDIVLLKDRTALGPYTRAQIQEGLSRGEVSGRDLAHTPGLKDWLPLLEVLHHLDREPVHLPRVREAGILPPVPGATASAAAAPVPAIPAMGTATSFAPRNLPSLPVEKAAPFVAASEMPSPLSARSEVIAPSSASAAPPRITPPDLSSHLAKSVPGVTVQPPVLPSTAPPLPERRPAPLRQRFIAWAIDCAILFVPVLIVFAFAYAVWLIKGPLEHRDPETARQEQALLWRNLRELIFMVAVGFAWIYAAGLESSRWQGTVGKQCMGLIVTDEAGQRLSFVRATGRHAAKYLSALPLFLGFMAASFNPQRLTWHDRLAGTRVVER